MESCSCRTSKSLQSGKINKNVNKFERALRRAAWAVTVQGWQTRQDISHCFGLHYADCSSRRRHKFMRHQVEANPLPSTVPFHPTTILIHRLEPSTGNGKSPHKNRGKLCAAATSRRVSELTAKPDVAWDICMYVFGKLGVARVTSIR